MAKDTQFDNDLAQAFRRSHCDLKGQQHECAGTCIITADGLSLECKLCGSCDIGDTPNSQYVDFAERILYAAGISWDKLNTETKIDVVDVIRNNACPWCGVPAPSKDDMYRCSCGASRFSGTWKRT